MTRNQQQQVARIRRISEQVARDIGVGDYWQVKYEWHTEMEGTESGVGMDATSTSCITKALAKYRRVVFHWYLKSVATISDEHLYLITVHEWVHVLLSPSHPYLKSGDASADADELSTENVTRALFFALGREIPED